MCSNSLNDVANVPLLSAAPPKENTVIGKIEGLILQIVQQIMDEEPPIFVYDRRSSWDSVVYSHGKGLSRKPSHSKTVTAFGSVSSLRKFSLMLHILSKIHYLLSTGTKSTKRQIYYEDVVLFGSQGIVDRIVEDIACMLEVQRHALNLLATSKGCIAGNVAFTDSDGNFIDCESKDVLIPSDVRGIREVRSPAKFILVIEKDATFQKLLDSQIVRLLGPCVLITGKGFPDVNTREMLRRLHDDLDVPVYALVDADPYGIEILCVYAFGSLALADETLAVPRIRWLGIHPSDIETFQLEGSAVASLGTGDKLKLKELMRRPYILRTPAWKRQLEILHRLQVKSEIQGLCSVNEVFLSDVYIPSKIKHNGWL
ncbi:meiotic recombination protein SPO11-like [Ornithodoros turicata]|uniref:meiotic recombination protein SPO11-like n=1 Tax=Ornithodoros turicata TaxID=34597 RepID=UPI003139FBF1